jgi:coenzyme F420-dependent glucose-6-phosphate dehydrogenase
MRIGYALSSEENPPSALVEQAVKAEAAGFEFALISDHFHPWMDRQGHSPFVWAVLGAIARETKRLRVGTGVTCPLMRMHPAVIAHAAATIGCMMPGRFFLGLGTGENLNEHITGERWPRFGVRREMLAEAVEVIRGLWKGGMQSHRGRFFTVEDARIYDLPNPLPAIYMAAAGEKSGEMAGRLGDGLVSVAPKRDLVEAFENAGGRGKPKIGQIAVCWAADEATARRTAKEWWASGAISGAASQELPLPEHFEQLTSMVTEDMVAKEIICGPDPRKHLDQIKKFADAGFDHVYVHQVGPDQDSFFEGYRNNVLPEVEAIRPAA